MDKYPVANLTLELYTVPLACTQDAIVSCRIHATPDQQIRCSPSFPLSVEASMHEIAIVVRCVRGKKATPCCRGGDTDALLTCGWQDQHKLAGPGECTPADTECCFNRAGEHDPVRPALAVESQAVSNCATFQLSPAILLSCCCTVHQSRPSHHCFRKQLPSIS